MTHALLRTLPGRTIVAGILVKIAIFIVGLTGVSLGILSSLDLLGSIAIALGAGYFLVRGLAFARNRLLWRVRRRLIVSYIFVGFVPVLLIVAFFLLSGLLLFSNFSSYLVQNRFRMVTDRVDAVAQTAAVEVRGRTWQSARTMLARRRLETSTEAPALSIVAVPTRTTCPDPGGTAPMTAGEGVRQSDPRPIAEGPWPLTPPPASIPGWIPCSGFSGLLPVTAAPASLTTEDGADVDIVVRAVRFSVIDGQTYALVVDLPIGEAALDRLTSETGVGLTGAYTTGSGLTPLERRAGAAPLFTSGSAIDLPLTSVAFLEGVNWQTGDRSSLRISIRMNVRDIYNRIASGEGSVGQYFGRALLVVLVVIGMLFLVIEFFALLVGLGLARSITVSVDELFAGTERVRRGDFGQKIALHTSDQLGELATSFNQMTASIEDLLREQEKKKRLEEELRIAHEIQMSLLPHGPLGVEGLTVSALCVPAREVGGDYYDFFPLDDHRVGVLIADVSGKGTSAALYMAELKGLILSLSRIHSSPRGLLIEANQIIAAHLDARSFITMLYAVLDLRARTITYARAGHTPLMYRPVAGTPGGSLHVLAPDGLVVGLKVDAGEMFERLLQEETMAIREGDLFVFFTDGITEAMNSSDECFGEGRLGRIVEEHAHLPSDELRERVLREIGAFVGAAPQHDDMTMILVRVGAPVPAGQPAGAVAAGVEG